MKTIALIPFVVGSLFPATLKAQTPIMVDLKNSTPMNCSPNFQSEGMKLVNTVQKTALLWLNDIDLKNGVIELDIKGKDVRGESFLGVAFHAQNDSTYSAIYFRPFNFKSPDRKNFAVQFIDLPGNDWDLLRDKYPGKYENAVSTIPDPNDWFHAKIVINFPEVRVFVNEAKEPSLVVTQISKSSGGKVALWMDSPDGWFRNVKITKK